MGKGMASNLVKKGFNVAVHDLNSASIKAMEALGAQSMQPESMAKTQEIIVTMLRNTEQVQ